MSQRLGKPIDQIVPADLLSIEQIEIPFTEIRDLTASSTPPICTCS